MAALLQRVRLGGLSIVAAFATVVYLVAGFNFTPLTATRKIVLLGLASPLVGILADFLFRPTRLGAVVLALAGAAASLWVFLPALSQKSELSAWLLGGAAAAAVAFMIGSSQLYLSDHPVRAGAAGLGLGLGVGAASMLTASATYGLYGIALGAGAGAFLLVQILTGRKIFAGTLFMLPAALIAGLVACGAMILAQLPWYSLAVLALVPLGARLPVSDTTPVWLQAVLLSLCTLSIAGAACVLAWRS